MTAVSPLPDPATATPVPAAALASAPAPDPSSATPAASPAPEARARPPIRVRGRSFMSFVLAPELPLAGWIAELDALVWRSPAFFVDRPVIDMTGVSGSYDLTLDLSAEDYTATLVRSAINQGVVLPPQALRPRTGRWLAWHRAQDGIRCWNDRRADLTTGSQFPRSLPAANWPSFHEGGRV